MGYSAARDPKWSRVEAQVVANAAIIRSVSYAIPMTDGARGMPRLIIGCPLRPLSFGKKKWAQRGLSQ